jgi:hypothetical protein
MHLKWPGFNEKGTVIIQLAPEDFSLTKNRVDVLGEYFTTKTELHITLIGTELGMILLDKIKQDKSINQTLAKTFEKIDWTFRQTGPLHLLARTKDATVEKSIIMLLDMHGVEEFYEQLKTLGLIGAETPVPPAHVTLYTQNCPPGIGVSSSEALGRLTMKTLSLKTFSKLWGIKTVAGN